MLTPFFLNRARRPLLGAHHLPTDLDRQLVKSSWAVLSLPELQIEIPAKRGQLTTVEGVLSDTLRDLELDQPVRRHVDPPTYAKIEQLCNRLRLILGEELTSAEAEEQEQGMEQDDATTQAATTDGASEPKLKSHGPVELGSGMRGGSTSTARADPSRTFPPFSLRLDDPSGNSFVEFTGEIGGRGVSDNKWSKRDYPRTRPQNEMLGLAQPQGAEATAAGASAAAATDAAIAEAVQSGRAKSAAQAAEPQLVGGFSKAAGETEFDNEEIYSFPGQCSSCSAPLQTLMKKVNIPYFKDIIIMSTNCDRCGYRDNEVKSGAAISDTGRRLVLAVADAEDLSRDVLKSETAGLEIPEIELHLAPGTLGGRFTTLEGLLQQVFDELSDKAMVSGDSAVGAQRSAFEAFLGKLKAVMRVDHPFTVIIDDPLSNSYIQNPYAPDEDEQVKVEVYTRSHDQNEELGLNDINVENYGEEAEEQMQEDDDDEATTADAAAKRRKADEISAAPGGKEAENGADAIKKPRVAGEEAME